MPHTPVFPRVAMDDPGGPVAKRYAVLRDIVEGARPDALLIVSGDHFTTYGLDAVPTLAVHVGDMTGPADPVPGLPPRPMPGACALARHVHRHLLSRDFDPAVSIGASVDHGVVVPWWFLDPAGRVPVVAVHVNTLLAPLPSPGRCLRLGQELRAAVRTSDVGRVAVIASGSFSLEVGGPALGHDRMWAVPDPGWAAVVVDHLTAAATDELAAAITPDVLAGAGTVAGEILAWLVVRGATDHLRLASMSYRPGEGHAFAGWHN
ncbi:DODA-type extradiol aromatic ring-opening family dioxygenase [Streptomyces sp. SS8]